MKEKSEKANKLPIKCCKSFQYIMEWRDFFNNCNLNTKTLIENSDYFLYYIP